MDLASWTAEKLLKEYEDRDDLINKLVGTLYPPIVADERWGIVQECTRRFGHHPVHFRMKDVVLSSWTDEDGVTHRWQAANRMPHQKADDPVKTITCIMCIADM